MPLESYVQTDRRSSPVASLSDAKWAMICMTKPVLLCSENKLGRLQKCLKESWTGLFLRIGRGAGS